MFQPPTAPPQTGPAYLSLTRTTTPIPPQANDDLLISIAITKYIFYKNLVILTVSYSWIANYSLYRRKALINKHGEPLRRGVVMYPETEVLIKLSPIEIQQALAIDLDRDPSQALQFIKEKIVDKYFRAPCKLSSALGAAP